MLLENHAEQLVKNCFSQLRIPAKLRSIVSTKEVETIIHVVRLLHQPFYVHQ